MKVVFRYAESTSGPIIRPQWPFVFAALQASMAQYPNVEVGAELTGYTT